MPGLRHETVVELVHRFPQILSLVLSNAAVPIPAGLPREVDSNLSARRPLAFLAENVFLLGADDDPGKLAIVVEVQTDPPDREKHRDWAAYLTIASREHRCDAVVLVFALSSDTARASRRPWRIGPGNSVSVIVIGPDDDPPDGGPALAAPMTVLAAVSGAIDLDHQAAQVAVLDRIASAPPGDRAGYTRVILAVASDQARAELEVLMATAYKETLVDRLLAEGEAKGKAEGEAKGEANLLLRVLQARGLEISADVRDMVTSCTDTTQLETWFDRALTATSLDGVFSTK